MSCQTSALATVVMQSLGLSTEDFPRWDLEKLTAIAEGPDAAARQWLEWFLGTCPETSEKRALVMLLETVPFGYRTAADGLHLEADPAEQGILSRIRELKTAGVTTRQIAAELNRQGLTTRRGTAWRFQYVAEALRAA
jgi:hypothetical protein